MRIAYLGPRGTFSEEALKAAVGGESHEQLPKASIYEAILAVQDGDADRALVPFENSIEGAVRSTLDALAFDAPEVAMVGEYDFSIRHCLIARTGVGEPEIEVVLSHPQASAQCARFIRENLPGAEVRGVASNAEAVRQVAESPEPWAALGSAGAAEIYGAVILRDGVEDEPDNITRFIWLAPRGTEASGEGPHKTSLVFSELGDDHPGALVEALSEFSLRRVNLTRIESRPLRRGLGRYMFFCDLEGGPSEAAVADAIAGLERKAESVRLLGSYPVTGGGVP
ncbi:MAG: prephenate dehydratase [Solirubrobacterales bacterium]